ncbi:hypothetical protein mvi_01080 [Methylobacterium indicum]|uniref:Uncharacterized protein n=1 Tax=Methylobacterium indicum TaxID=1775910 RepID=A0A8H9C1H9_9HYPH|nr:hypothetical protein mvi_01080 [Methylobacterium indicum]
MERGGGHPADLREQEVDEPALPSEFVVEDRHRQHFGEERSQERRRQGEADTKWCSCCTLPGATRADIGSTLLRSPGQERAAQIERRPASLFGAGQGGQKGSQPCLQVVQPRLRPELIHYGSPARLSKQEIGDTNLAE